MGSPRGGSNNVLAALCSWYMNCLDASPMYTKSVTSAVISLLGDGGAQYQEQRIRAKNIGSAVNFNYNRRRGLTNFADSALVCTPLLHLGHEWLQSTIPVSVNQTCSSTSPIGAWSASHAAAAHVIIDDFIFDAIFVAIMFISAGIGEGYFNQIVPNIKKGYLPAVKTVWKTSFILMPLEFCIFRFLPLSLRVLGINMIDVLWDAIASFMIHKPVSNLRV